MKQFTRRSVSRRRTARVAAPSFSDEVAKALSDRASAIASAHRSVIVGRDRRLVESLFGVVEAIRTTTEEHHDENRTLVKSDISLDPGSTLSSDSLEGSLNCFGGYGELPPLPPPRRTRPPPPSNRERRRRFCRAPCHAVRMVNLSFQKIRFLPQKLGQRFNEKLTRRQSLKGPSIARSEGRPATRWFRVVRTRVSPLFKRQTWSDFHKKVRRSVKTENGVLARIKLRQRKPLPPTPPGSPESNRYQPKVTLEFMLN